MYDLSELDDTTAATFHDCSIRVLCAGTKAWELPQFAEKIRDHGEDMQMIVFSFSSKTEESMIDKMEIGDYVTAYAPWNPDIWQHTNKEWHEQLLIPVLKERLAQ